MVQEDNSRRSTHVDIGASYAAIGASQAVDLLKFPPTDSTPFEFECLLGSGNDRFVLSSALLMTWGAQKGAGLELEVKQAEINDHYYGTQVSDTGQPSFSSGGEQNFAPDGTPYMQVGSVVTFKGQDGFEREMRVLSVINEQKSTGFIIGTTVPQEVTGEEFFRVEMRADDSVWAVVRGFYHQGDAGVFGLRSKKRLKNLVSDVNEQINALTPAAVAKNNRNGNTES